MALAVTAFVLLVAHEALLRWDADALGPVRATEAPAALGDDELRVVTWNAWRLKGPQRAAPLVAAIDRIGAALADGEHDRPELVTIQEIESLAAIDALEREMQDDGFFAACECASHPDGRLRSAVAIAVRAPLTVRAHECIPLAGIFPDHPRCAVLAGVTDEQGRRLSFVGVHLAWHFASAPMAQALRAELRARRALGPATIIAGDLNAWPGTEAFERLSEEPLRDTRPRAPPTHFLGWRIDHVLAGRAFDVVRGIDRRWSYETFEPTADLIVPRACVDRGPPHCPYSDHLPEAVVLRWRDADAAQVPSPAQR